MYFLIAQWGGPRREYAAIKFFLYTLFGSVFMLVGIVILYLNAGTFDLTRLSVLGHQLSPGLQWWIFLLLFLGFAVKVPVWPLHTWLPDAHVEAPTAASAILAGVLLKMGMYGFIRVSLPVLPDAFRAWQWALAVLAMISIIYGAAVAFAQTDIKKLVAYSSVSHMGFAMLGIAAGTVIGIDGAIAVAFSHGLISGMLFLMVGQVYDRTHTREISEISGLAGADAGRSRGCSAFASFAAIGIPGLSGFIGEFLSLLGAWQSDLAASSGGRVLLRRAPWRCLHAVDDAAGDPRPTLPRHRRLPGCERARGAGRRPARDPDRGGRGQLEPASTVRGPCRPSAREGHGESSG